jgi:serine/threonine-protein kinase
VLHGELASGGMASVHFGRLVGPAGFARAVAIKRLHPHLAREPEFVKMFLDEARLAARVTHPNVVSTLDVIEAGGEVFLVMEYVRGATLSQLLKIVRRKDERMPVPIALGVISGILHGLHAAHEAKSDRGEKLNLVHRDVSPQNALVGADGVTRLLDFGIAKAAGRLHTTRDGELKGKLAYMAPEQVRGGQVSARTDVYAASVVLWETLTGERLFTGDNEAEILDRVLHLEVARPTSIVPGLPAFLDVLVLRGLHRDPAERFSSAREMAAAIDASAAVASTTTISAWVEETAAEPLSQTAARITLIERSASEQSASGQAISSDGTGAFGALSKQVRGASETQATVKDRPVKRPSRARKWLTIGGIALGLTVPFLFRGRAPAPPVALGPHAAAGPESSTTPVSGAASPVQTPLAAGVEAPAIASALPETSAVPAAGPGPSAAEATTRPRPAVALGAASGPVRGHAASVPPRSGCNPPYTVDARGHVHFKPDCL